MSTHTAGQTTDQSELMGSEVVPFQEWGRAWLLCSPPCCHMDLRYKKDWWRDGCHGHTSVKNIHSWRTIIISTDGFNLPPSISFANYTVEKSAVVNNQINEFGYSDTIIAAPLPPVTCTTVLYLEIWAQAVTENFAPKGTAGSFLLSTEQADTTVD